MLMVSTSRIFTMVKLCLSPPGSLRLGYWRLNGRLISRSQWRPAWCFFPHSLGYPLVQDIWSSIAQEFFYLSRSGYRSGDHGLDQEIWSFLVISIGRL